jgi:hypothetical protein
MNLCTLTLASLLATSPLLSIAQAPAEVPTPRYYVGLTAYSSSFQPLGGNNYKSSGQTTVPVQVVAGYQLRPRWAVQLGAAYTGYRQDYSYLGRYAEAGGGNAYDFSYNGRYTVRKLSLALLGRYTLTRTRTHRLQVDALGGFTYEHSSVRDEGLFSSNQGGPLLTSDYGSVVRQNHVLAGLGTGLRLRAARRLDVMLDVVLNVPLHNYGFFELTSATALGLRYRFGGLQ